MKSINKTLAFLTLLVLIGCESNKICGDEHCEYLIISGDSTRIGFVTCNYPDGRGGGRSVDFNTVTSYFYQEYICVCESQSNAVCDSLKKVDPPEIDKDMIQFGTRVNEENKKSF